MWRGQMGPQRPCPGAGQAQVIFGNVADLA